jgi:glycosyltransferase involved in cell wall biosynthesis
MMRVAHLIDSLHWGGAEKWIASFSEVTKKRDLNVSVMSLQPFFENNPYRGQLESFGASVKAFSITRLYKPTALPLLIRTLRAGQFDIIQTHLSHSNILGTIAGRWVGIPVVATLHSTHLDTRGHYHSRSMVEQLALRYGAHRVMAVGNSVAEAHRYRMGNKMIDIVPNGVKPGVELSTTERNQLRTELTGDPTKTLILAVGRFVPLKGYAELLSAFSQVKKNHPKAFLALVGDGRMRPELERQLRILELAADVCLTGLRVDIPRVLAAGDIFVNSSHWEGLSMAMLEAMAAGLPILATQVGEAPYLLAEGRGLLVQPHDADGLAAGLTSLLDSPTTRQKMGSAARGYCESNYSLGPWLDKVLEVYTLAQNVKFGRRMDLA